MSKPRIAVGQISAESNHFVPGTCGLDFFRTTGYLLRGEEMYSLADSATEIGGILHAARSAELVPLIATRGNSSAPLSAQCWRNLKRGVLQRLEKAGAVDGVVMSHHGSMAVEGVDDPEGELAFEIRALLGPHTPFAMTLDLHGNVTDRMVAATSIICAYQTYPHQDVRRTGARAARLLLGAIRRQINPVMAHVKLPMILTAFRASTAGRGPFAQLMRSAQACERQPGILSASLFFVGSYIDIPAMGCGTLVIADGDARLAHRYAKQLAQCFWAKRNEFIIETVSVAEAVRRGRKLRGGPVLLLDTADTTGGGAAGDSIALVQGLLEAGVSEPSLAMVVDPLAARRCHQAAIGATLTLSVGHRQDRQWGKPIKLTGKLVRKSDGRFRYHGGILGGTWSSMGPSAVLQIGNLRLLVMSYPTYDYACEQYESMGQDPRQAKFVGVKNMMNFRVGYRDIMKGYFVLDCPGPTPTNLCALPFQLIKRPVFPLDANTVWEASP